MRDPIFHRSFSYDRNLLPNAFLRELETGVTNIEQARQRTGATIGYPGWGLLYYLALASLRRDRPNVMIETGTNWGSSTIVLAEALAATEAGGHLYTFELESENVERARSNIAAAGHSERVIIIEGDAKKNLKEFVSSTPQIDFAFLDGLHLIGDVLQEFEAIEPSLAPGALVCFDNTYKIADDGEDPRVFGALKEIRRRFGGSLVNLPNVSWYTPGFAIWQRQSLAENAGALSRPGGAFAGLAGPQLLAEIGQEKFFHAMDLGEVTTQSTVYGNDLPPNYHLFPTFQYLRELDLSSSRCLDIGTYDGMTAFQLCELGAADVHATCQYVSKRFMLVHALKRYQNLHYYSQTHLNDVIDLFVPMSLDLVVISAMLHHHPAPAAALLNVRRLLRRGGYFVLEAAVALSDTPETELNTIASDPVYGNPTIWIPSERTLLGMLNLAAFEICSVTKLVGTEAGRETNYRRITILARAVAPPEISGRSSKLAEIQDRTEWVEGIDFKALAVQDRAPAAISWSGEKGTRTLPIWFEQPSIPLQPAWSDPRPERGTCARIATNDRFMDLMAHRQQHRWTPKDVALIAAKYPGEHWPDGMDWSLKQCGNLFCIDHMLRYGTVRVLEIGPGFNMYFKNHLPNWMEYWAIDDAGFYEPAIIEFVRDKRPHGRFVQGIMGEQRKELEGAYFDCTFSVSVIEHVPRDKIAAVAADIWRVTRPGGWTVHSLDVPAAECKTRAERWITALCEAGFGLDKGEVDLDADAQRKNGGEIVLEPMSIIQTFHRGYCPEPWLRKPRPAMTNRCATVLLSLRRPLGDCDIRGNRLYIIGGVERKIHFFAFDLPHSDACFAIAYPAETTVAFCDGRVFRVCDKEVRRRAHRRNREGREPSISSPAAPSRRFSASLRSGILRKPSNTSGDGTSRAFRPKSIRSISRSRIPTRSSRASSPI